MSTIAASANWRAGCPEIVNFIQTGTDLSLLTDLLIPLNVDENHWMLLWFNKQGNHVDVYDSLEINDRRYLFCVDVCSKQLVTDNMIPRINIVSIPRQVNGYVFVICTRLANKSSQFNLDQIVAYEFATMLV